MYLNVYQEIKTGCYLNDIDFGNCYYIVFRIILELLIKMMSTIRGMSLAVIISAIGITMAEKLYGNQGSNR